MAPMSTRYVATKLRTYKVKTRFEETCSVEQDMWRQPVIKMTLQKCPPLRGYSGVVTTVTERTAYRDRNAPCMSIRRHVPCGTFASSENKKHPSAIWLLPCLAYGIIRDCVSVLRVPWKAQPSLQPQEGRSWTQCSSGRGSADVFKTSSAARFDFQLHRAPRTQIRTRAPLLRK